MHEADSRFLLTQIPLLEKRFCLSYFRDCSCVEYFLDARTTGRHVSQNLILSLDDRSHGIYVSKFYPCLSGEKSSKYLSAACFYRMVHHAAHLFDLKELATVWLETDREVFENFYAKLHEFEFEVSRNRVGDRVCLKGVFHDLAFLEDAIPCLDTPFDYY